MAQRSFKLADDLDAWLVEEAERLERPASWVIVKALEAARGGEGIASEPRPGESGANGSAVATAAPSRPASPRTPARPNVVTSPALQRFASGGGPARPKGGER